MDRRSAAKALVLGVVGAWAGTAQAQPYYGSTLGPAEAEAAAQTGRLGSVSLYASRAAQRRAYRSDVREFADFEAAEQTNIAAVLAEVTGGPPPALSYEERAELDRLQATEGAGFERAYVRQQIDGHRRLLAVQERYLSVGRVPAMRHVAILARGQILEHLRLLADIQQRAV